MSAFETTLQDIPEECITDAQQYLVNGVNGPIFDELASQFNYDQLPAADMDEQATERLSAIGVMSEKLFDLRGMQGGRERQNLDLEVVAEHFAAMGFEGINDPESPIGRSVIAAVNQIDMVRTSLPPAGTMYEGGRIAPGAFATSVLPRVQFALGRTLTPVQLTPEGGPVPGFKLPESMPDPDAHAAFASSGGLVVTLGSHRLLNQSKKEHEIAALYAPDAKTEFDLLLGAVERELAGRRIRRYEYELPDAGYATVNNESARAVVHEVDDGNMVVMNLYAPKGVAMERGRVQTGDTYQVMRNGLKGVVAPDERLALVTNSQYKEYQLTAAIKELRLFGGWRPEAFGFGADVGKELEPSKYLLELHSYVKHLGYLATAINQVVAIQGR